MPKINHNSIAVQ